MRRLGIIPKANLPPRANQPCCDMKRRGSYTAGAERVRHPERLGRGRLHDL
jgi:hypothetical protein